MLNWNDLAGLVVTNLILALTFTPIVLIAMTAIRSAILLAGRKREFEEWTRNPVLSILSIIFLPGSLVYVGIRYLVCSVFGFRIESIGTSTTYGEVNLYLNVERPPRVGVVIAAIYAIVVLSVFSAMNLMILPMAFAADVIWPVIGLYVALGVLFNASVRSGDISLIGASLRKRPRSGALELVIAIVILLFVYIQILEVPF
ncbi:MAG: hypothetical protein ACOC38_03460 [Promethearchaeia archaeon]